MAETGRSAAKVVHRIACGKQRSVISRYVGRNAGAGSLPAVSRPDLQIRLRDQVAKPQVRQHAIMVESNLAGKGGKSLLQLQT